MEEEEEQDIIQESKLHPLPYFGPPWQWQSDVDPRDEKSLYDLTFKNYSDDDCLIIEQAFLRNEKKALLKYYEIDFKRMLQVNRRFRDRVRQVRRLEESRFLMEMPEPIIVTRDQKTMNEAFGSIQHFLNYLVNRTPEASRLYLRLTQLQLNCQDTQFQDVIQEVLLCIEKGAEARQKASKEKPGGRGRNFLAEARNIRQMICQNSSTARDFLKSILKVYTMESFICYWLNELLRSENWEEINVITPYLVCLVYSFKLQEYIIKHEAPKGRIKAYLASILGQKLFLYRGAALAKEHLELYDPRKVKYFSWNAVTSTSRHMEVASKFAYLSLDEASQKKESKLGVIFKIEIDFNSIEDCEGMIDISQNSRYPQEQEVILAPGTVFELIKTRLMPDNIYEISLKVRKKFQERKTKIPLLGILLRKAIQEDRAVIKGLPSRRGFQLLELLRGNKLIQYIEIRDSEIDECLLEEIEKIRLTTHVTTGRISFISNTIFVSSLSLLALLACNCSVLRLRSFLGWNNVRFIKKEGPQSNLRNDWRIEEFTLFEGTLKRLKKNGRLNELWELIKNETQLQSLKLSFREIQVKVEEFSNFLECLEELQSLEYLNLELNQRNASQNLDRFCEFIKSSQTLQALSLQWVLSDAEISRLLKALMSLPYLQELSLYFGDSESSLFIWSERIGGFKNYRSLQYLRLIFSRCTQISEEGIVNFMNAGFSFSSLQDLTLKLRDCKISNKVLLVIGLQMKNMRFLKHLHLDFGGCKNISDEGLKFLIQLELCVSLEYLYLYFGSCGEISNTGLYYLEKVLPSLLSLKYLSLDFENCRNISDEGLAYLYRGLLPLSSLHNLSLFFAGCKKISYKGVDCVVKAVKLLPALEKLYLQADRFQISEERLKRKLSSLKFLDSHVFLKHQPKESPSKKFWRFLGHCERFFNKNILLILFLQIVCLLYYLFLTNMLRNKLKMVC